MNSAKLLVLAALAGAAIGINAEASISIDTQPANQTVAVGAGAQFYVSATTSTTNALAYQWYKRVGSSAATTTGSNNATNTIAATTPADEATYWVVVSDGASTKASASNKVLVVAAPAIFSQPTNLNAAVGSNYTFTISCTNRLGVYSWYFNATNLLNSTTNRYPLTSAQLANSGAYTLVLSNLAGQATSAPIQVQVFKAPVITNQPATSITVPQGANATNSLGVDGTGLSFQWFKGKAALSSTSNTLVLTAVTTADSGTYLAVASNAVGKVTSANWALTVIPPPTITTQPRASALTNGQKLTLTVKATGTKPYTNLFYCWQLNATNLSASATNATYVVTNTGAASAGTYTVIITNFGGAVTSAPAAVTIGSDTLAPVLKITSPTKTNSATTNGLFTLKGTATDNVAVTNVSFSLNGNNFTNAVSSNAWATWSADVPLAVGSNTLWVQAQDFNGNAITNKLQLFYAKWYSLSLVNSGTGAGTFTGATGAVQYGSNYVLTAKPNPHNVFAQWAKWTGMTVASNAANSWKATTNVIKFSATNDVVLTYEMDTNQFWNIAGTYFGLLTPGTLQLNYLEESMTYTNMGGITLTLSSNLAYSLKLGLGGRTLTASGLFKPDGNVDITMPGGGDLRMTLIAGGIIQDPMDGAFFNPNQISVAWVYPSNNFCVSTSTLLQPSYSKTNPASGYAGTYTLSLPPDPKSIGGMTNGYGYGTLTIASNGTATVAGITADGQVFTQSTSLVNSNEWPLFVQLYPYNKTNYGGMILAYSDTLNDYEPPTVVYIKAVNPPGISNYTSGFTNYIAITNSVFTVPTASAPAVLPHLLLGSISFIGGGQATNFSSYIFADEDGSVYTYNANISLKFGKDGTFSGKFPLNNDPANLHKPTSFSGVVLQCSTNGMGSFMGPSGAGTVLLRPITLH